MAKQRNYSTEFKRQVVLEYRSPVTFEEDFARQAVQ